MKTAFHKMHGIGNDFVVVDARARPVAMSPTRARALADRRTGVGCDQVIMLEPSPGADAAMRIWNADGGEVEACGNAFRAAAVLIGAATLSTRGGDVRIAPDASGATAELQPPRFGWEDIPLAYAMDTFALPLAWEELRNPIAINVGNPHLVFFSDDQAAIDLEMLGPRIENDPVFPERINVNVAAVTGPSSLELRTWERGAGLTRACGTGACAAAVAAIRARYATSPVTVIMRGGTVVIDWQDGGTIRMSGPATQVFTGELDLNDFPL